MSVIYVQTKGTYSVGYGNPQPIPDLSLTIPPGAGEDALVTLNVPNPEAWVMRGSSASGGAWFGVSVNGVTLLNVATFAFPSQSMGSMYVRMRVPVTLIVAVPLAGQPQKIVALWRSLADGVTIDSPASLSAEL